MREAAVQLGISFEEEEAPGQNDVVRFVFPPLDSAMTYRLASAVRFEAYAKRALVGGVSQDFFARKFPGFDAPVAFAGDVDLQRGVLQTISDGVGDHRIANGFASVIQRQLGGEERRFVD